ncbi:SdrD B-like domain-containing protein, partial [Botrimarina sp.]|uniref:SdrD B-like domain-containing protein n=1 Tax=Botrimarina sp. TaxID=2795802 RepID=UPI0032EBEEDE
DRGSYRVVQVQPTGWLDGLDTPGTHGGSAENPGDVIRQITLDFGDDARQYNFGEMLPGSIAGAVHSSPTGDCHGPDATPIAGVKIDLLDASGAVIRSTVTDAEGAYRFDDLPPGQYAVREHQPAGYFDGDEHLGSENGVKSDDLLSQIVIGSAVDAVGYDFCELPPAQLSGYVFIDGPPISTFEGEVPDDIASVRDGARTPDDAPLRGVKLRLVNGVTGEPFYVLGPGETIDDVPDGYSPFESLPGVSIEGLFETTTDRRGFYAFENLPSGSYAVVQIGPEGLIDGIDTPGSTGGVAVNPIDPSEPGMIPITPFRERYGEDVIFAIPLTAGQSSIENNFSEVDTVGFTYIPPVTPPETPPPFVELDAALPPPRQPLRPVAPPTPPGPTYVGGGGMIPYTWHLSVVNAGRPRAASAADPSARLVSRSSGEAWDGAERAGDTLQQAKWRLLASDVEGADLNELLFGAEDAVPVAGDWDGDGVTEIGVYINGDWYLDLDGDGRWGAGDLWAHLGGEQDLPVTGDWDGDGKTDIGVFGPEWRLDPLAADHEPGLPDADNWPGPIEGKAKNLPPVPEEATSGERLLALRRLAARRADLIDHVFFFGVEGDHPVTGDFNGDGVRTIGVFREGRWTLDTDGDGRLSEADTQVVLGTAGDKPLVGDFDGDGVDELGVYRAGEWLVDPDGDGLLTALRFAATDNALADADAQPVVGDWDGDGADEPGLYSPAEDASAGERVAAQAGATRE